MTREEIIIRIFIVLMIIIVWIAIHAYREWRRFK